MGVFGYFGGTENGTWGAQIKILRPLFSHAGWQAAEDVMTILSIDGGSNYICLQWQ